MDRLPVVAAVGQVVDREGEPSAVDLAERAARAAFDAAPGLAARVGRVSFVGIVGPGPYNHAPAGELCRRLGLEGAAREVTTIGGNTPQWLVNRAAADIAAGRVDAVLIAGGEAMASKRPARPGPGGVPDAADPVVGDDRFGVGPAETAIGLILPAHVYPMLESVLAARAGRSHAEQRAFLGRVLVPFTETAAKHPCAWTPEVRTADEIAEPSADNRIVAEPYTKRMNAFLNVNQGAALVVTSLAAAKAAGVADGAVFVLSGASAADVWFPSARPDLGRSPGIAAAAGGALHAAGLDADDVSHFDLYSCFPVALELAALELGIALDDRRGLTVTGGLPYFGGPGNNYVTHAIATMVERVREAGGAGLVTALGWYVNKHAAGVYGDRPPAAGYAAVDTSAAQDRIDAAAVPVAEDGAGRATVDAATVVYGRDGSVSAAPVIGTLADGRRVVAAAALEELPGLEGVNLVGGVVDVSGSPPAYRVVKEGA
jgi:acetyl-CoA C-acetyltransferase